MLTRDEGVELSPAEIEALDARWANHWTPSEAAEHLAGVAAPWCVAAGWALDLFRGRGTRRAQSRPHGDLEIAIPADAFPEIRDRLVRDRFPAYVFDTVDSGRLWEDAAPEVIAATHQTWLRDPSTGDYVLDVFREPHEGDTWIFRHNPLIRLPYRDLISRSEDGIPYLAPEFVLLFKAKHARAKDQADFDATVPHLSPAQRATLADLLARTYPEHAWLERLEDAP